MLKKYVNFHNNCNIMIICCLTNIFSDENEKNKKIYMVTGNNLDDPGNRFVQIILLL